MTTKQNGRRGRKNPKAGLDAEAVEQGGVKAPDAVRGGGKVLDKVLDKAPDAEPGNAGAPPLSVSAPTAKRFYPTSEGYPAQTRGVLSVGRP